MSPGMDGAAERTGVRLRAGWVSLIAGVAIFAGKLAAWRLTGSTAVMSDALESLVNVAAAALLVFSLHVAARPADRDHPYGHGKIEFFSAGIEGGLVLLAAVWIWTEAVAALIAGPTLQRLDLGTALLAIFGGANAALATYLARAAARTRSDALAADARHIWTDVWTTGGVLLGLALVALTGWTWLDPLIAFGVAAHILREGWRLTRAAIAGLMDEADVPALTWIAERLESAREPEWIDAHGLRTWRAGASMHVDLHLLVPRFLDAERLHRFHESLERELAPLIGDGGDLVVHFDPCRPFACERCSVEECALRASAFVARPAIDFGRATRLDPEVDHGAGLPHSSSPEPTAERAIDRAGDRAKDR